MPPLVDAWALGWLPFGPTSVGTTMLSYRALLERRILNAVGDINAETTLIPKSLDMTDGGWHMELTTWAQSRHNAGGDACKWVKVRGNANYLVYQWRYRDEWKRKHEDSAVPDDRDNLEYSLECECTTASRSTLRRLMINLQAPR